MSKEVKKASSIAGTLNGLIVFLTSALCFLTAVGFYLKTYDSATIKITFVQIGGVILTGLLIIKFLETGIRLSREAVLYVLPVIAFFIWGFFSYLNSPFKIWASFDEFWRRCIYTGLFLVAFFEFRKIKNVKFFTYSIFLTTLVVTFYGIIQKLGLDPYAWKGAFGERHFSTFGNPNFFGAWLAGVSGIIIAYLVKTRNILFLGLYVITALNVWWTGSKGAVLGLAGATFSCLVLIAIFGGVFDRKKATKIILYSTPLFVILLVVLILLLGNPTSYKFRIFTWMGGMEMLKRHPVAGTGIGSFKTVYPMYRPPEIFFIEGKHNTETDHFHCEQLEVFYDEGFIGVGIFLLIIFLVFYSGIGKISKLERVVSSGSEIKDRIYLIIGWLSGIAGMFLQAFMSVHMRFVSSGHLFWIMLGLIGALTYPAAEKKWIKIKFGDFSKIVLEFLTVLLMIYFTLYFRRFFIADVNHNIAIAYSKQARWDRALFHYDRVITNWPRFIMAHYFMGNVYNDRWNLTPQWHEIWDKGFPKAKKRTDPERAIDKYKTVLKMAPNYVQTHYQMGVIYTKLNVFDKAIGKFNQARDIDPIFPLSPFRMGYCYVRKGNLEKAEENFKLAIHLSEVKKQKPFIEAYTNLANVYFIGKKYALAEEYYKKAAQISNNPEIYLLLAGFYKETGRKDEARKICKELLKRKPENKKVQNFLKNL